MRKAKNFRYHIPTRTDVAAEIALLINGDKTRQEIAEWATEYLVYDDPQVYPQVDDPAVFEALEALGGADLVSTDRDYLYGPEDFQLWLEELNSAN